MRIRTYRQGDFPTLMLIQQEAAHVDGREPLQEADLARLLAQPELRNGYYVFLITDDDDELNTWGQGETLEGVEGEVVGYAILQLRKDQQGYHFRSQGAILPEQRQPEVVYALLLCALNHARMQALNVLAEARRQGKPIYFEILLDERDPATAQLASTFELEASAELAPPKMRLYRVEL